MPRAMRSVEAGAVALFLVLALAYTASIGLRATNGSAVTGDEPFYLVTTQSLIEDRDFDLRQQYASESYRSWFDYGPPLWTQSGPLPDGRVLSPHDPGLAVYLVPGFALAGLEGAQAQLLLTAALTFTLTFLLIARETGAARLAWCATLAVGLSATAFVYATEVYPEVPAALCLVASLLVLRAPTLTMSRVIAIALLITGMAWLGVKYLPLGAILGGVALLRAEGRARTALVALAVVAGATYVAGHLALFGALTPYNSNLVYDGASTAEVLERHLSIPGRAYRLVGLFVDQHFGLGRWAPVLLVAAPALPLLLRRGTPGGVAIALIVTQLLIATFVAITMMGWWFPGRTLVTVLPLLAWPLTEVLLRASRWARVGIGLLALYSTLVTAALTRASMAHEVRLAVDPFDLHAALFRLAAPLFPDYRAWTLATSALHVGWLLVGLVLLGVAIRAAGPYPLARPWPRLQRLVSATSGRPH